MNGISLAILIIKIIIAVTIASLVWFIYRMGHPKPGESKLIYKLRRHPSAIPEYFALLSHGFFHPRLLRTGSTLLEKKEELPGDELLTHPRWQETRATTIDIPVQNLWPWIVQMGGGRGGWYWWTPGEAFPEYAQYIINTTRVLEQFQVLNVGDRLSDGGPHVTEERGNWVVRSVEPNQHLVLYAARQVSKGTDFDLIDIKPSGIWFICSWAFVLRPISSAQTRLLIRVRGIAGPTWLPLAMILLLKGDTVAHSSMMERIKCRSEAFFQHENNS